MGDPSETELAQELAERAEIEPEGGGRAMNAAFIALPPLRVELREL
jgi:hypothetical protein